MKFFLLGLLSAACAVAQPVQVHLDPHATTVGFTLGDVLHTVHGTFQLSKGDLWFDPATGHAGGQLVVGATTGDSGSHARDSRMTKNVLEANRFAEVTFTPDRIEGKINRTGDSTFQLHGLFAIHGASHELLMNVKSHFDGPHVTASASFDVPYVKWGMKDPSTLFLRVSNAVHIQIETAGSVHE